MAGHRIWKFLSNLFGFGLVLAGQLCTGSMAIAADLEEIRSRGYLVVGVKDNLRPLGYRTSDGTLQGFEIDLAHRLAEEIFDRPDSLVLKPLRNLDRLNRLLDGDVDILIAGVTHTSSRARVVSFSVPYYLDGMALGTRHPEVDRTSDLAQKTIALLEGSSNIAITRYLLPGATLVGVDSYEEGKSHLATNQAQAFAGDSSVLSGWVQEFPEYRLLPSSLSVKPIGVVIPKGIQHDDLRRYVNRTITRWHEEGWLSQRAKTWGLPTRD